MRGSIRARAVGASGPRRAPVASRSMPASTPPIAAIASTPRSGRDPCAATPVVSISSHRNPLCATHTCRPVGSVTIAASAQSPAAIASLPRLAYSSSHTPVTITSPRRPAPATRAAASMIAARPPFMSYPPLPYRRPASIRGENGSAIPSTPTTSMCAFRSSERPSRPPPVPTARAITFGRPGAASCTETSSPARSSHPAANAATCASPAPPGTRSGLIESMATRLERSSATPSTPAPARSTAARGRARGRGAAGRQAARRPRPVAGRAASSGRSRPPRPCGTETPSRPPRGRCGSASNPHAAATIRSGAAAATASHVVGYDGSPARPSTSTPPAVATISGSQCPAAKGGSSHSATNTRTGGAPATARATAAMRASMAAATAAPSLGHPEPPRHDPHRLGHLGERARIERQHLGVQAVDAADLVARHGAHVAQVLGDDQVGGQAPDQVFVERVQRPAVEHRGPHRGVDLAACERLGVDPGGGDDRKRLDARRVIALGRARHQLVGATECADDLGGAWQQGADAQAVSVAQPGRPARSASRGPSRDPSRALPRASCRGRASAAG